MHGCCWLVISLLCWLATVWGQQDDSLRGALEAISRRQRNLADDRYYMDRGLSHLSIRPEELQFYESRNGFTEDGQPEDIGYGYQKSLAPHTAGIFEPVALPNSELGSHDNNGNEHMLHLSEKEFQRLASDYSGNNIDNRFMYKYPGNRVFPNEKRSIFRERGDSPESMQHLYSKHESGPDIDTGRPVLMPSSFRERYPGRTGLPQSALALVRSFGGLDRDTGTNSDDDDSDEYMNVLNSIWEKYKNNAPEGFDPEELTESDLEEMMNYFGGDKEDKKRFDSYGNGYGSGYDFFNSPISWNKREKQRLDGPQSDGFFHALKFLSGDRDVLETLHNDDLPTEDNDEDVAKILLEKNTNTPQYERTGYRDGDYRKRLWHDSALAERFPYHNKISKRFPVTKRSSSLYPGEHKSIKFHSDNKQRQKKNVNFNDVVTDPKVAQEIKNIFSTNNSGDKDKTSIKSNNSIAHEGEQATSKNVSEKNDKTILTAGHIDNNTMKSSASNEHVHYMHRRDRDVGQKEESESNTSNKPLDVKKKSIDWSDYFGIDRRRKKSLNNNFNDEWLLNQYLRAYSLSNNGINHQNDGNQLIRGQQYENFLNSDPDYDSQKKGQDDIDNKLRAMEDLIVDEALKYTGAHEGITDSKEVQKVKDRVMSKLAAAYSLEKMRRALGEFKSSIAAQKDAASNLNSTPKPDEKEDKKSKRVAVKKEKAELELKDKQFEKKSQDDNNVNYIPSKPTHPVGSNNFIQPQDEETCPVLEDVAGRCRQISIIAGDRGDLFLPLCTLHQICYLCGPELGTAYPGSCDISFLTEANTVCHDSDQCRFAARRMLAGMRSLKGDPSPAGCDWGNNPCLARFLALATDR